VLAERKTRPPTASHPIWLPGLLAYPVRTNSQQLQEQARATGSWTDATSAVVTRTSRTAASCHNVVANTKTARAGPSHRENVEVENVRVGSAGAEYLSLRGKEMPGPGLPSELPAHFDCRLAFLVVTEENAAMLSGKSRKYSNGCNWNAA